MGELSVFQLNVSYKYMRIHTDASIIQRVWNGGKNKWLWYGCNMVVV